MIFSTPCFAADETLTITTYYPSPYGSYNNLTVAGNANFTNATTTYYAPVAGEPSVGTLHLRQNTTTGWFWTQASPTANTWYSVTFTNLPPGTKMVRATIYATAPVLCSGYLYARKNGSAAPECPQTALFVTPAGAVVDLPIDSTNTTQLATDVTSGTYFYVSYPSGYWM